MGLPQLVSWAQRQVSEWRATVQAAGLLWWAGFSNALCLHRCLVFFIHDHNIWVKTAQCFILNGVIFLGSVGLFQYGIAPGTRYLLDAGVRPWANDLLVDGLQHSVGLLYNVLWLLPAYAISFVVNCLWYQDIAEMAFLVHVKQRAGGGDAAQAATKIRPPTFVMLIGQEVYRVVLFCVFFTQVLLVGMLPVVGPFANFVLLSWLYAFYCFDYKWSIMNYPLNNRIQFFESQWAFFSGFGTVCTLTTVFCSFYVGAALMAIFFPLFILIACDTKPREHHQRVLARVKLPQGQSLRLRRVPIFSVSTWVTRLLITNFSGLLRLLRIFGIH